MAVKLTEADKLKFITENEELIPVRSLENFKNLSIDKQYTNMCTYVRKKREKETMVGQVKSYLKSTKVRPEDVKQIIEICNVWLGKNKEKLIKQLEEQIKRLEEEKNKYNNL